MRRSFVVTAVIAALFIACQAPVAHAAHTLSEPANDTRVFNVSCRLEVGGTLETALRGGKAQEHKLSVNATIDYRERRLPGAGRDAQALRSARYYDQLDVTVKVGGQTTSTRLPERARMIVAQGYRQGVAPYSLSGPLTAVDLELLQVSGDSLATLALLPPKPVEKGDEWQCESWVLQMLTGTEAALKSNLKCKLISVTGDMAEIEYEGSLDGASAGAATKISVSGKLQYDLKRRHISRFELSEKERRTLGTKPGYDVVAHVVVERKPADDPGPLTDEMAADIPLEPAEAQMMLSFDVPWGAKFLHDRNWHLFRQTPQAAVLRLLDKGSFIAQCNIAKVADADPGQHTPEPRFHEDIRQALGDQMKDIVKAEELKGGDGVFRYRVTVAGEVNEIAMTWLYYLCAAPSGKQVAFVFAVETKLLDRLTNRDLGIVSSLEFSDAASKPPQPAK